MATIDPTTSLFRIDIEGLVRALLAREREPIIRLQEQRNALDLRSATLTDLRTTLNTLRSKAQELLQAGPLSPFQAKTVNVSDGSLVAASASNAAVPGVHALSITQLAKAHTVVSGSFSPSGTDIVAAEGPGTKTFRLTVAGTTVDISVLLEAGDTNRTILQRIASAINTDPTLSSKVTASVVDVTGTESRLTITSKETGTAKAISLADITGTLVTTLNMTTSVAAQDASFTLNGVTITRGSNTISDAISGVTFTLKGTTGASPVTLTVATDAAQIRSKVEAFLNAYNAAIRFLKERTAVTVDRRTSDGKALSVVRGPLAGEPTFVNLLQRLRTDMTNSVSTVQSGSPKQLSEIGISAAADGTLSLSDPAAFEGTLASDGAKVADLFTSSDGVASRMNTLLSGFVQTGGVLDGSLTGVSSQVKDVNNRIASLEARITLREKTLRQQLNAFQQALDVLNQQRLLLLSG